MSIESPASSRIVKLGLKVLTALMESRFRYRFFGPARILSGTVPLSGLAILEVGCGTGFFTLPVARLIGDQGYLVAIDKLSDSVELVTKKIQEAGLRHVRVIESDALNTDLNAESFDMVLLFGVIPAPMLPLNRLLPEIHRVLKEGGGLAVWPPIPVWMPRSILQSGLFTLLGKKNGVYSFRRC